MPNCQSSPLNSPLFLSHPAVLSTVGDDNDDDDDDMPVNSSAARYSIAALQLYRRCYSYTAVAMLCICKRILSRPFCRYFLFLCWICVLPPLLLLLLLYHHEQTALNGIEAWELGRVGLKALAETND